MSNNIDWTNLTEELEQVAYTYQQEAIRLLNEHGNNVSGRLANSIRVQPAVEVKGVITVPTTMLQYGVWVDNGAERGSGKQPPVPDIVQWIKLKNIPVPTKFKSIESFAFAVARSIGKKGQTQRKSYPFIVPALNFSLENTIQNIANAAAQDEAIDIQKQINKTSLKTK